MEKSTLAHHRQQIEAELRGNILPFWMEMVLDRENGGYYGAISNDLVVDNEIPRSAVVAARILWTFSAAYRAYPEPAYLDAARHAADYLLGPLWDPQYAGIYWSVNRHGRAVNDRKHVYAQAFAIYALAEYFQASGEAQSLARAKQLFTLIETHSHDSVHGGNIECLSRSWGPLEDMRLSVHEPAECRKSMNTLLHLMEAYTNLLRAWPDPALRAKLDGLVRVFLDQILDLPGGHFRLFFDDAWNSLQPTISYGHDIEGSWLLVEAAEALGDAALLERVRAAAVRMAEAVYAEGRAADGSLRYDDDPHSSHGAQKHWWPQAEGLVGFYGAYQLSGRAEFAQAALACWDFIATCLIDRIHGDWFKAVDLSSAPVPNYPKVGPWECPYHHARACLELLRRLG